MALVLVGCGNEDDGEAPPPPRAIQADGVAAADVLGALVRALEGEQVTARWPAWVEANATDASIVDVAVRYLTDDAALSAELPPGQWAGVVDLAWRVDGVRAATAQAEVTVVFEGEGDETRLVRAGGGDRVAPLWLQGPIRVARADDAVVLVAGEDAAAQRQAGRYLRMARRAQDEVRDALGGAEPGLVIEAPRSSEQLATTLGAAPDEHAYIAAVTTTVDGSTAPGSPVHVFLNPRSFGALPARGAQVVMTHEATHVATEAAPAVGVPLWLTEGFADWVALRSTPVPVATSAAQIIAQVRSAGVPRELPGDAEFEARSEKLGAAYEAAWVACLVLVEAAGEERLLDFHAAVVAGSEVDPALRAAFGFGERELIRRWRAELVELAR